MYHPGNAQTEKTTTASTNTAEIQFALALKAAHAVCASIIYFSICDKTASYLTSVAFTINTFLLFLVPPNTMSPPDFGTGLLSRLRIDYFTVEMTLSTGLH